MTAPSVESMDVTRVAPSGEPVDLSLPAALGGYRWYGNTRFVGPRVARQFFLAPAGEHRAIPNNILRGARESRRTFRGYDAVVFEAPDRSDAALVLAGPYHEATTWFGGPAPDAEGLSRLVNTFSFVDSPSGATLRPASDLLVQQPDVTLIGRSAGSILMVRRSAEALPTLPDWAGLPLPGGELWRGERVLDPAQAALVEGTPHQWRYLLAGESAVMDLVLLGPESGRPATPLGEEQIVAALAALGARWGG
ncbi:hypothetical protein ACVGVM_07640 [Pseudonocardia bannensis]|uniref:Uncharacterized protein n=1 Tax=Pseudonocardia bannensis TaxID=630973 RepID=A0A848DRM6_9PSEU|nr:hypothetical protein [Pseudonocardia bannensis]NMH95149.1 hypothetical protein [Pseudonocardia bannensis]